MFSATEDTSKSRGAVKQQPMLWPHAAGWAFYCSLSAGSPLGKPLAVLPTLRNPLRLSPVT